jgi:hypothetical protein
MVNGEEIQGEGRREKGEDNNKDQRTRKGYLNIETAYC